MRSAARGAVASTAERPEDIGGGILRSAAARALNPMVVGPLAVFVVVVALWQLGLFHAIFGFRTFTVPYPDGIVGGIEQHGGRLLNALGQSAPAAAVGYLAGLAVGLCFASILMLAAPGVANRIVPFLTSVNAMPIAAVAPLLALWMGAGFHLKVAVVVIMIVPTIVVYAMRGFTSVNPTALELMASLDARPLTVFRTVRVPTALPYVLTAMKSCVVLALIGVIVTEVVTGFQGIGFMIVSALAAFQTVQGWLALLAVAGLGISWYLLIDILERLAVPWDQASRRGE